MEHLHACCVCKKRLPDRKKRISLFGQTGKAKDIRKGLVLSFPLQNSKTASICLEWTFSCPIFEAASRIKAESAIVRRSYIASSPYRSFTLVTSSINIPQCVRAFQDINEFSHRLCARPLPVRYATYKMADGRVGSGLRDYSYAAALWRAHTPD